MYLLKSTTGQTILFDDGEISFFNNPYITKQQRFIIAIFGIVIAVIGLFFHIKDKHLLFLIAYLILFLVWGSYFIMYLIKNKDPEIIKYSEISGIDLKQGDKVSIMKISYDNNSKTYKIKTTQLEKDLVKFLDSKRLLK